MATNLKSLFGGTAGGEASSMAAVVAVGVTGGGSGHDPTSSSKTRETDKPIEYSSSSSTPKSSPATSTTGSSGTSPNQSQPHQRLKNRDLVITSLIAGATAGALAKTTIAPLDRTKINFQINKDVPYSFRAALLFLHKTYTHEGFLALWRGNSATMARIIPYSAIQFTAHEQWKKLLQVDLHDDTKVRRFMAGALAGITSQSLTYPLDLARARMAVTDKYSGYRTLREVFVKIWQCEGPRTLYRGYWATILGVIPYAGTSFFTYDTLKKEYYKYTGDSSPNTVISLVFGATAGVIGQSSSYPLDIVRRRMQTTGVTAHCADRYLTIGTTLAKIYREEGFIRGFYKGLSMNWIKGPIAVGISFATYDHIRHFLREVIHVRGAEGSGR
ncbi:mitochondrial coenzyme A transporter SLC25A42 [Culex quinquefasciatus]|uniref:mitochondrial coenzyme A transporter SLC25A42 n=1 Tax=Culex quinquefasciatus TaxID=7176 RepID=UPI0018E329D6|nr:mitochondrial coenzyme A transporter SLC25A42 [Culex quinquefasciatus]XP_038104484.1 mitochondrial coenzyme A transporter SLC25A42 [Culex quinquefasciatus]